MAAAAGISEASVRRIWHAHGLKPHLVRTFKLSRGPQFIEKLEDIVGLYLNPLTEAAGTPCLKCGFVADAIASATSMKGFTTLEAGQASRNIL